MPAKMQFLHTSQPRHHRLSTTAFGAAFLEQAGRTLSKKPQLQLLSLLKTSLMERNLKIILRELKLQQPPVDLVYVQCRLPSWNSRLRMVIIVLMVMYIF